MVLNGSMVRPGPHLLRAAEPCDAIRGHDTKRPMNRLALAFILIAGVSAAQPAAPRSVAHYDEAKLSQPKYKVRTEANVRVPMRDGVTLATDIYRPDAEGRFPTILVRTPYNRATAQSVPQSRWFAERGYAVLQQDVRGRWDSDGHFYAFKNEANDGFDMDEWIGKQP